MKGLVPGLSVAAISAIAVAAVVVSRPEAAESSPREASVDSASTANSTAAHAAERSEAPGLDRSRLRQVRWIAAASGETPEFNQVSVEQDLGLARAAFGDEGYVLFAAGADLPTVQVLDAVPPRDDPTIRRLADFFAPRGGRDSTYRVPAIDVDAPATAANVAEAIRVATERGAAPLLLYLAGHGHQGESAADNEIGYWEQSSLSVSDIASLLSQSKREVRVVATTCFSGGLAELAFANARAGTGPSPALVCGLFAAPADLEASGCDPNPDRASQEGFAIHFLNALKRLDRDGTALTPEQIDFDGDGSISLLEAHARVRIASKGPDVPTSTTERWLEVHAANLAGPGQPIALPEVDAVVDALVLQTGASRNPDQAATRLAHKEREIDDANVLAARAGEAEDRAFRRAAAELLARWPVLDDPWHPQFAQTLAANHAAITLHLETSPRYAAYVQARNNAIAQADAVMDLRVDAVPHERLSRALDYRTRAAQLKAQGGPAWERFELLLRCERSVP